MKAAEPGITAVSKVDPRALYTVTQFCCCGAVSVVKREQEGDRYVLSCQRCKGVSWVIKSRIIFCGVPSLLVCDGKCNKAWGLNERERVQLDPEDEDDYEFKADHELGDAPEDPGTYEGSHAKPVDQQHNKWCARECERSEMVPISDNKIPRLWDWSLRQANVFSRREELLKKRGVV